MVGRALLIGVSLDGLSGCENDVEAMAAALGVRGFTVERCVGADATRDGILAAYERLTSDVEASEPAVVYYSGHGGRATAPAPGAADPPLWDLQFIVPFDFHASRLGDYRVITSVELSVLLAGLTAKTDNAVVILDCCHAAHMSRRPGLVAKAAHGQIPYEHLRSYIEGLRKDGKLQTDLRRPGGDAESVRIVACAPDESAYEYDGDDGRRMGALTESLVLALAEAGQEPVSWASLIARVRRRVRDISPGQRPEAEGRFGRLLFQTAEADLVTTLPVCDAGPGRARLELATFLGTGVNDTFVVMPADAAEADPATKIGDVRIDRVGPVAAEGPLVLAPGRDALPIGARAHRETVAAPAIPVLLPDGPQAKDLARAVAAAPLIRPADPGDHWQAAVRIDAAGRLTVEDRIGPLHAARAADAAGVGRVVRDLNALARAAALSNLAGDDHWALHAAVKWEWGVVEDGERHPLPPRGAVVPVGAMQYFSVRNSGTGDVYIALIDIGVAGRVAVLTAVSPSGERLAAGQEYVFGLDGLDGVLTGEPLTWPEGVDATLVRPETTLLLVTSAPLDVSVLEQEGVRGRIGHVSSLQQVIDQIGSGRDRDAGRSRGPVVRYDLHTIDFGLDPGVPRARER
ncbi:caspase family protein [Catenulispora rubra]|uniref:caspase family protein n=1 Tax=Catenulispora rubra TaxID=280293 RepID=UPI0018923378|nr:caspase family protein [Catenulispora rubra]